MAVTITFYDSYFQDQMNGGVDLDTDTIKLALCTSTYTPDRAVHNRFDDITNEVAAAGYAAGGATLTTKALNLNTTTHRCAFDSDDVAWTANMTARYAVLYKSTGVAGTSPLIAYVDFGQDETSSGGGTFTVAPNASGWFYIGV